MPTDREHDIVLFGATGFTGGLTAQYLAEHAPAKTRWALAGRNMAKLEAVRERLGETKPKLKKLRLALPTTPRERTGNPEGRRSVGRRFHQVKGFREEREKLLATGLFSRFAAQNNVQDSGRSCHPLEHPSDRFRIGRVLNIENS